MPYYETLILADPRLGRGELHGLLKRIVVRLIDAGGVVTRLRALPSAFVDAGVNRAAARPLPQELRGPTREKHRAAIFVECGAFLFPQTLTALQRQLRLDEQILRISTVRRPAVEANHERQRNRRAQRAATSPRASPTFVTATSPVSGLEMFVEEFEKRHPTGVAVYDAYRLQESPFRGNPSSNKPKNDAK
ncbi:hypothetical protein F1559_003209 [Cyanidiococcus yangmingshanensis]|uniref:Uncharacterized protein n=1 Tax=Cyanidiococcus yangmingshanensis TaxID=2690220 RepID=A0A7J7IN07_9RHOD|nr:hypothetical protein F1559_003209 [Cyanidiococcus yangmingshanensis]